MNFKNKLSNIRKKIRDFFYDEWAGNMTEYALLIGFALFLFFIIIGMIVEVINWTIGENSESLNNVRKILTGS